MRKSLDLVEDAVGGRGPAEGPGGLVVRFDEAVDAIDQFAHFPERAAPNRALRNEGEPAFHLIEPGRVRRREVEVKPGMPGEPRAHGLMFVRAVVVEDEMHGEVRRDIGVQLAEEGEEFLVPMPPFALREDLAGLDVERREQRRGAMPRVVVRDPLDIA